MALYIQYHDDTNTANSLFRCQEMGSQIEVARGGSVQKCTQIND